MKTKIKFILSIVILLLAVMADAQDNSPRKDSVIKIEKNGKWGLADSQGKIIVSPKYNQIYEIEWGIAVIDKSVTKEKKDLAHISQSKTSYTHTYSVYNVHYQKRGCFNIKTKKEIIPPKFYDIKILKNNLIFARVGERKWINFDHNGKEIIPTKYITYYPSSSRYITVWNAENKIGYLDEFGSEVVAPKYDFGSANSDGTVSVSINNKWGYLNKDMKEVIAPEYENRIYFWNGYASVKKDGKWGHIDQANKIIIPFVYDDAHGFYEGLAAVKKGDKWGYIDINGNEIVPFKYIKTSHFRNGEVIVVDENNMRHKITKNEENKIEITQTNR